MGLIRRTAGLWGPGSFAAAAVLAARLQPGYSHVRHHISGLAASGQRSATVMVPGFMALGTATLAMPVPGTALAALARTAGTGVIGAGLIPASQPRCPQPTIDPEATAADLGHGIVSVVAFTAWTAIPFVAAAQAGPAWYRRLNRVLRVTTAAGFVGAAVTTRLDASVKGLAQRAFLASVFTWYAATAVRSLRPTG
jgi:uncharacterized membrane protein